MGFAENVRMAVGSLLANKTRALLTMLGIIIGIAAVIGILTVGDGLSGAITGTMSSFGASSIAVSLQEKPDADDSGVQPEDLISDEMIAEMTERFGSHIEAVSLSQSVGSGQAKDGRLYANVSISGVNDGYFTADETELLGGRFLRDTDEEGERMICVVSDKLVNNLFGGDLQAALGSEVNVQWRQENLRFHIVGVYEYEASMFMLSTASDRDITTSMYIPVSTAKQLVDAEDGFSSFNLLANAETDSLMVAQEVEQFLNRYYRNNSNYGIFAMSMDSIIESVDSVMDTLSVAISVIAAISLLVGGIGVMNIMLVSVTERTREIGTRKALGATNANIRLQFVVESALICLVGGIFGIILGAVMGYVGSYLLEAPTLPSLGSIMLAVGFSLAVGVFFGYYPANKAAKLDPIEALRYE